MHHVYIIINEKDFVYVYVGTSVDPHHRFIKHCSKSSRCRKLRNAIKKHGRENFRMLIVESFRNSRSAYNFEVELIAKMKSDGHLLYNLTSGGKGAPERVVRNITRTRISEAMKRARESRISSSI